MKNTQRKTNMKQEPLSGPEPLAAYPDDALIKLADRPAMTPLSPSDLFNSFNSHTAPILQPFTPNPRPNQRTRNGKIARLPKPERDMVNRMLFNNIPSERIVGALDEIGIKVTRRNISNWKTRGGYREWCLAQEHALQMHSRQDHLVDLLRRHDASELPEVGLQAAATELSQFFLTSEASQLLAANPEEYDRRLAMLSRVAAQLKSLQKYRDDSAKELGPCHHPERLRREVEKNIENTRHVYSSTLSESPKIPIIPHRNYLPKPS